MDNSVGSIIRSSLKKIGVLASGEPLTPDDGNDALIVFQQMISAWSNETLLIPVVNRVKFKLINNISEYTIGIFPEKNPTIIPKNHFETARPLKILSAFIRDQSGTDFILKRLDSNGYSRLSVKDNGGRPSRFYLRKGYPINTIFFDSNTYVDEELYLEVVQPFSETLKANKLTDIINLPEGYERALIYNLAIDLADDWGRSPSAIIFRTATDSKKWIKRNNYRDIVLDLDLALQNRNYSIGTYNIEVGP